jgi:acyl CoA:acetate/3-ketoacid CoA transferase beta subunit
MSLDKNGIAKRIAQELQDGFYVNLVLEYQPL